MAFSNFHTRNSTIIALILFYIKFSITNLETFCKIWFRKKLLLACKLKYSKKAGFYNNYKEQNCKFFVIIARKKIDKYFLLLVITYSIYST